jgi:hypothetical protein
MRVHVSNDLSDLTSDMRKVAVRARRDMVETVRDGIRAGSLEARTLAKRSAGAHGKHYHRAITAEMSTIREFGGVGIVAGEYGPDISKPQGGMSFENGSRNQKPHRDLAKSADLIGPVFAREVERLPDGWFWPND